MKTETVFYFLAGIFLVFHAYLFTICEIEKHKTLKKYYPDLTLYEYIVLKDNLHVPVKD